MMRGAAHAYFYEQARLVTPAYMKSMLAAMHVAAFLVISAASLEAMKACWRPRFKLRCQGISRYFVCW